MKSIILSRGGCCSIFQVSSARLPSKKLLLLQPYLAQMFRWIFSQWRSTSFLSRFFHLLGTILSNWPIFIRLSLNLCGWLLFFRLKCRQYRCKLCLIHWINCFSRNLRMRGFHRHRIIVRSLPSCHASIYLSNILHQEKLSGRFRFFDLMIGSLRSGLLMSLPPRRNCRRLDRKSILSFAVFF